MKIKSLFSFIDKIPFSYKTSILIFIITGGMFSIIFLSQISIYTLKDDFDILFDKRTQPIIKLEAIKDTYKINIYDTLFDVQQNNISYDQAKEIIALGQHLINKNWNEYQDNIQKSFHNSNFLSRLIKNLFSIDNNLETSILQKNIINNINKKYMKINKDINTIFYLLRRNDTQTTSKMIDDIYFEINSINIYITNLTNHDLNMAIYEKGKTQELFNNLTIVLNITIVFVFVFSILLSVLFITNFKEQHFVLEDAVKDKTKELIALNESLEKRIEKEVGNSRKKDLIMFQQARLASLGEMIANIAHQWRQPLGSLMMIIQSFQTKMEMGKLTEKFVEQKVNDAILLGDSMSNTLDDFQNFFRPNKDKSMFNLKECLEHAFELSKYFLEKEKINYSMHIKDNINIYGFYNELSHVFLNIISNSKDALKNKEGNKSIEVIVKDTKETIQINIFDNGGGIDDKIIQQIFEPYFTTKYKSAGTGIGLYMSKQIVEKHMKGSIMCKNIYYKIDKEKFEDCTLFIISIPYEKGKQNDQ